jgi:hypothetical protein
VEVNLVVHVAWLDRRGAVIREGQPIPLPAEQAEIAATSEVVPEVGHSIAAAQQKAEDDKARLDAAQGIAAERHGLLAQAAGGPAGGDHPMGDQEAGVDDAVIAMQLKAFIKRAQQHNSLRAWPPSADLDTR